MTNSTMLDEVTRLIAAHKESERGVKAVVFSIVSDNGGIITFTAGDLKGSRASIKKAISDN